MPGWINDVFPKEVLSSSQFGNLIRDRVVHQFNSVAERDATAIPKLGMMCYCVAEKTLYIFEAPVLWWNIGAPAIAPQWCVFDTGWVTWSPQVWSGPTTTWSATTTKCTYRRTLGTCEVHVRIEGVTLTSTVAQDLIYVQTPVATPDAAAVGTFGTAVI